MKKDLLRVVAQGFYGSKTETEIRKENLDRFILGYLDDSIIEAERINRTTIKIPNAENIVIVYNKFKEEEKLHDKKELADKKNYELRPVVFIPEEDVKLYSRCIVCRVNEDGEFESLQKEDYEKFMKYLAD